MATSLDYNKLLTSGGALSITQPTSPVVPKITDTQLIQALKPAPVVTPKVVAPVTKTVAPLASPTAVPAGMTPEAWATTKAQLDLAYNRAGGQTATDKANIAYAIQKYGYVPPSSVPTVPATPAVVTPASVTSPTPTPVVPASPVSNGSPTESFMSGINAWQKQQDAYLATTQKAIDQAKADRAGLVADLGDAMTDMGGKADRTAELSGIADIAGQTQRLKDMNTQIATLTAQFDKGISSIEDVNATGLSTTIAGKAGELRRQKAVEIGALTSVQQAMSGNLALSQQTIKDTVDLEFEDKQAKVDALKTQLDLNYQNLTAAQKEKADELLVFLDAKAAAIADEKQTKTDIYNLAVKVGENGGDNDTITKITKATTLDEAIQLAGSYLQAPTTTNTPASYDEWILAGQPGTYAEWVAKDGKITSDTTQLSQVQSNLALVNDLLASPLLGQVTGLVNPFTYWTPGSDEQMIKNKLNQLKANLSLENRTMLKGSGAISDFEAKLLEKAASALGSNLSDADLIKVLKEIKADFEAGTTQPAAEGMTDFTW